MRDPKVALAYHARQHGFSSRPPFVLVQGDASVDLTPSAGAARCVRAAGRPLPRRAEAGAGVGPAAARVLPGAGLRRRRRRRASWRGPICTPAATRPSPAPPLTAAAPAAAAAEERHRAARRRRQGGRPADRPAPPRPRLPRRRRLPGRSCRSSRPAPTSAASASSIPAACSRPAAAGPACWPTPTGRSSSVCRPACFTGWLDVADDGTAVYAPHTSQGLRGPAPQEPPARHQRPDGQVRPAPGPAPGPGRAPAGPRRRRGAS